MSAPGHTDLEARWWSILSEAVGRFEAAERAIDRVDEETAQLAALWALEADTLNGGLMQFYCNWGDEVCELAGSVCRKMGDNRSAAEVDALRSLMKAAYRRSQEQGPCTLEYWDLPRHLEDGGAAQIEAYSVAFCAADRCRDRVRLGLATYGGNAPLCHG